MSNPNDWADFNDVNGQQITFRKDAVAWIGPFAMGTDEKGNPLIGTMIRFSGTDAVAVTAPPPMVRAALTSPTT